MFTFADSFDMYATLNDMGAGYWDSASGTSVVLAAGRFTGQCLQFNLGGGWNAAKASNVNDAVHHFVLAFRQSAALTGTLPGLNIQLFDSATAQCTLTFRADGALLLQSGSLGATLATYAGAVNATNIWIAFEIEVVIHNTAGSITVRKNGNTSNDFTVGSLNTRGGTTNNYANKILLNNTGSISAQLLDDLLWRSDPTSVAWMGDVRSYVRMPVSDASVQFSRVPNTASVFNSTSAAGGGGGPAANQIWFMPVTPSISGSASAALANFFAGVTGHVNMALYDNSGPPGTSVLSAGSPGALLAQGTPVTNPGTGLVTFTFATPATVTKGVQYWVGIFADVTLGTAVTGGTAVHGQLNFTYSSGVFPVSALGTGTTGTLNGCTYIGFQMSPGNYATVSETLQDGTTTYVYDATVGHADFYTIAAASPAPTSVVAVTTRGFIEKSDAGARSGAVQLKSGATTAQSASTPLASNFNWLYRTDGTDPNTGSAWTPAAVDALQIGPVVTA